MSDSDMIDGSGTGDVTTTAAEGPTEPLRLDFVFDDGGTAVSFAINGSEVEDIVLPWNAASMTVGTSGVTFSADAEGETSPQVTRVSDLGIGVRTNEDDTNARRILEGGEKLIFTIDDTSRLPNPNEFGLGLEHLIGSGNLELEFYQNRVLVETASYALSSPTLEYNLNITKDRADVSHISGAPFDEVKIGVTGTLGFEVGNLFFAGEGPELPNVAPDVSDDRARTLADRPVTISVLDNDLDTTGSLAPETLRLENADDDSGLTRTVLGEGVWQLGQGDEAGLLTFTPDAGYVGTATVVSYTVGDTKGAFSTPAAVTVIVDPPLVPGAAANPATFDTILEGTSERDVLTGTDGSDYILGYEGVDNILGGDGNDYIVAGTGQEWSVYGGDGADVFYFQSGDERLGVRDFEDGVDRIHLGGGLTFADLAIRRDTTQSIVTLTTPGGDRLQLYNVDVDTIGTEDFDAIDGLFDGNNLAPAAEADIATTPVDTAVTIDVLANDIDPDGTLDSSSVVIIGASGDGRVLNVAGEGEWAVQTDGTITFTPETGYSGPVTDIAYSVIDNGGAVSEPTSVSVTIEMPSVSTGPTDPASFDTVIEGTGGRDTINGTDGNDYILGLDGADNLYGGNGNDYLVAGIGTDWNVFGGAGADVFYFQSGDNRIIVRDFEDGVDLVHLGAGLTYEDLNIRRDEARSYVSLTTADGDRLQLNNVDVNLIDAEDFVSVAGLVGAANLAPVATADTATTNVGMPVTIDVLRNDNDADGTLDRTSVVITGASEDGKLLDVEGEGLWAVQTDGTITFTPETGYDGPVNDITYRVSDDEGEISETATVSVDILAPVEPGDGPSLNPDDYASQVIGDDTINRLTGTSGDDYIFAGDGNDVIRAGDGNDLIDAGTGTDWNISGEGGADIFLFGTGHNVVAVLDFEDGVDLIGLTGGLTYDDLTISPRGTVLNFYTPDGDRLLLRNVDATQIDSEDFLF